MPGGPYSLPRPLQFRLLQLEIQVACGFNGECAGKIREDSEGNFLFLRQLAVPKR
jgi:hypothetical protein